MTDDRDYYSERLGGLENRVETVERTLEAHGSKLEQIFQAVSTRRDFEPLKVLQFIALAIGIAAVAGTAITYVSTSTYSGRLAEIEFKTNEMWRSGRWVVNVTTVTKQEVR